MMDSYTGRYVVPAIEAGLRFKTFVVHYTLFKKPDRFNCSF